MYWNWSLTVLIVVIVSFFLSEFLVLSSDSLAITGLHVVGNEIRNGEGKRVIFHVH